MELQPEQHPAINLTGTDPAILGWHRETTPLTAYPAKGDPNILVIGAFGGVIAGLLIEQSPEAQHYLYEPQDWAIQQLNGKFGHLPNVHTRQYGLGDKTGTFTMGLYQTDTCSFMRGTTPLAAEGHWYEGELLEFGKAMVADSIKSIYYSTLNIEAYEFVLLPYMAKLGWLKKCQILGISWHDAIETGFSIAGPYTWNGNSVPRWAEVQAIIEKTHELVLSIDNWQTWVRKGK